jgi:hypothetical protein
MRTSKDKRVCLAERESRLSPSLKTNASLPQRTKMATLPDRTANVPLLNNFTERHLGNLPPENDLRSCEAKRNNALQTLFSEDRLWSIASIVGGFVIAVVLTVGHHTMLHYLHGRNIDEYPQVWIKGANNGFSNIFSIFVGLSSSSALTQIVRLSGLFSCLQVCLVTVVEMASFW